MRIPRVYTPQALAEDTVVTLDAVAAHHVATVLRMKVGRELVLFNGKGQDFLVTLICVDKKRVAVSVGQARDIQTESPLAIALGVCLIKSDRMGWLLQKVTELGVSTIYPLVSDYTDIKLSAVRLEKKARHWQQVIISACEQSGRALVPEIAALQTVEQWTHNIDADCKYVLHPYQAKRLTSEVEQPQCIALLVGPEGGLTDEEVGRACAYGFQSINLGPRILRAETAPLVALSVIQHYYGGL